MTGAVFTETLRRGWRGMIWWGIGLGFLSWIQIIVVPDVEALQQMTELLESLPPFFLQMFGASDTAFLATPEGYLALQLFAVFPLVLAVYAVLAGLNVVSSEEDRGIMDMILSTPVLRWRVVVEKVLAYAVMSVGVLLLFFAGTWLGLIMTPSLASVSVPAMFWGHVGMIPGMWIVLAFTALVTGVVRNRGIAIILASVFVIASYFLDTLGKAAPGTFINSIRPLSYNAWYDYQGILQSGVMQWGSALLIAAVAAVFTVIAMLGFQRRDVGL